MKIIMKKNQRIKLILDLINKKRRANPEKETFYFKYEEFTKFPLLNDQLTLDRLLTGIQEESGCIIFILPKIPEHLLGKTFVKPRYPSNFELYPRMGNAVEIDEATLESFITITVHIEDFEKFDKYYKKIGQKPEDEKIPVIILNDGGELYIPNGKEKKHSYPMEKSGLRYRIVHFLAQNKDYVQTRELAEMFEKKPQEIRKTIEQTRREIEKFLKIKGSKIIEGKKDYGYRIKNIKIK